MLTDPTNFWELTVRPIAFDQPTTATTTAAGVLQENIKVMTMLSDTSNAPERSQLFYLGLGASLREGLGSYLFMFPLGGAYGAEDIPLPAVLGERTRHVNTAHTTTHTSHTTAYIAHTTTYV